MLGWRLLISAILIPAFAAAFWFDHQLGPAATLLLSICLLLGTRAAYEMCDLLRARSLIVNPVFVGLCSAAVIASAWFNVFQTQSPDETGLSFAAIGPTALAYTACVLLVLLKGAIEYREPGKTIETLGSELLIISYVGLLLAVTAQLRWVAGADAGYLVLGSLLVAAKSGDIGAYTLGRLFGKRKMAPHLSPGKTWMGFWGALLFAGAGAYLWLKFATPQFGMGWTAPAWYWAVLYGVVIGLVGLIGDLCESLIKRDVGRKDASALLPGFGGILDLLDSLLYAGPVAYLLWQVMPLATWR